MAVEKGRSVRGWDLREMVFVDQVIERIKQLITTSWVPFANHHVWAKPCTSDSSALLPCPSRVSCSAEGSGWAALRTLK